MRPTESISAESISAESKSAESKSAGSSMPSAIASRLTEEAETLFLCFRVIRRRVLGRPLGMQLLPPSYLELLNLVRRQPGIRIGEAAVTLRLAPNTVSTLARALAGAGLVERRPDDVDQRVVRLHLTELAGSELTEWRDQRLDLLAGALADLDAEDRAILSAALPALGRLVGAVRSRATNTAANGEGGPTPR